MVLSSGWNHWSEEDNPLLTGNGGIISRVEKDEDIQELKSKSGQLDNKFRDIL